MIQGRLGKQLFVTDAIPDEKLIGDMVQKAKEFASVNAKNKAKTSYALTKEQLKVINDTNREWYKKRLENIVPQIRKDAAEESFMLVVSIPIMVMRDHFGDLMKKEVDGKNREIRFYEHLAYIYECFQDGLVTLEELQECLFEETGLKFERD